MNLQPDTYYHIYNRGNNRETIFKEARNYPYFLHLCKKHLLPVADIFCYCLLPNHFHFLVRTKPAADDAQNPKLYSRALANWFAAYAKAINKSEDRVGSLFQKNCKRKEITEESYFLRLVCYIHTNPQLHGISADYAAYTHSSYGAMLSTAPSNLSREEIWTRFSGKEHFVQMHQDYVWNKGDDDRFLVLEDDDLPS